MVAISLAASRKPHWNVTKQPLASKQFGPAGAVTELSRQRLASGVHFITLEARIMTIWFRHTLLSNKFLSNSSCSKAGWRSRQLVTPRHAR